MKLLWYSAGNIIYALGSLGYLAINTFNLIYPAGIHSQVTYIILVSLASIFVLDALLYTFDWIEQRQTKNYKELIACLFNILGSVLYLIGTITLANTKPSISMNSVNLNDIPMFVFSIVGILSFLIESILNFFTPRVSKTTSKCSIEFFAHLLNLFGNITYLVAHIIQPIIAFIASFTTEYLNKLTDLIYIIIRPIQIGGDIIYTIDAILYMIVWIKANEHVRKIGAMWVERTNITINDIAKKRKLNVTTSDQLPEPAINHAQHIPQHLLAYVIVSKPLPQSTIEDVESPVENRCEVESVT